MAENRFTDWGGREGGRCGMYTAEAVADRMQQVVRRAAEPVTAGERVTGRIERAARRLGLTRTQVKRLWYREQRSVPAHVALWLLEFDRRASRQDDELQALKARIRELREE